MSVTFGSPCILKTLNLKSIRNNVIYLRLDNLPTFPNFILITVKFKKLNGLKKVNLKKTEKDGKDGKDGRGVKKDGKDGNLRAMYK